MAEELVVADPPDDNKAPPPCGPFKLYSPDLLEKIELMYVLGLIFWLLIITYFDLIDNDPIVIFILLLPPIVYLIGILSLKNVTMDDEEKLLASSYLSIGILVIVPLLTWTHDRFGEETKILQVIVLAIILAVMSLIDIWVPANSISLVRHFRSILQVAALDLIIFVLYHIFLQKGIRKTGKNGGGKNGKNGSTNTISSNAAALAAIHTAE